ncbi:hypothetical protein CC2G_000343 [Coprinopsis cinerea AmutBmut pab1-1]|nr:hypothetical protein CC2G_000343 [Coprinopsis cinerea AmutBmut pab1-1]
MLRVLSGFRASSPSLPTIAYHQLDFSAIVFDPAFLSLCYALIASYHPRVYASSSSCPSERGSSILAGLTLSLAISMLAVKCLDIS